MNKVNVKIRHVIFSLLLIVSLIAFIGMSQNAPRLEPDFIRREPYYATAFLSESGTSTNPYVIGSSDDMHELSRRVAAGERFTNKVFVLGADISELNLGNFKPIGTSSYPFEGTFDGSGVNFVLSISNTSSDYQGLFGYVRNATLENFSVSGTISGRSYVGSIVGFMATGGTIRNVYSTATVTASSNYAGGILGYLERGTVTNTYFRGEVLANYYAAGIVGGAYNSNTITNSYSAGKVSANSTAAGVVNEMDNRYNTRSNLYY
ncbi:GLUG motif-containing protein, partial [Acholeplasma hippikon]|uniref:GLUG motif-containing protein n=1 Tax=Acholeplasma hippikon TaxID=264636 RepID=UPI000554AEF0